MSAPIDNLPTPIGGHSTDAANAFPVSVSILTEKEVRIKPLVSLNKPEPIPDATGSLTSDQLREIAKRRQPPATWFEGDEEQLF